MQIQLHSHLHWCPIWDSHLPWRWYVYSLPTVAAVWAAVSCVFRSCNFRGISSKFLSCVFWSFIFIAPNKINKLKKDMRSESAIYTHFLTTRSYSLRAIRFKIMITPGYLKVSTLYRVAQIKLHLWNLLPVLTKVQQPVSRVQFFGGTRYTKFGDLQL